MSDPPVGDAHCHLADLPDPDAAIDEAEAAGVSPIVAVAMGPDDGARVLELRARHPGRVIAAVGLHPSRVPELTDAVIERELEIAGERVSRADVVGEIGLDYKDARDPRDRMRQRAVLERMLALAQGARRPVNLHTRRADRELMDLAVGFTRRTGLPAVMHWFTHSEPLARACGEAGVFISVGPSILVDPRQAAVARAVHAEFLLVETDAPVVYGGETACPAWAARVARHLAAVRGIPFEEMAATLQRNLRRYLDPAAV